MFDNLSFSSIDTVIKAWELAKSSKGFSEKLGIDTLRLMIQLDPEIKAVFGLADSGLHSSGLHQMALLIHGKRIVEMVESTFTLLGPDTDLLQSFLEQLGQRHYQLGVKPRHFELVVEVLHDQLKEILGREWSSQCDEAWYAVLLTITDGIVKGMPEHVTDDRKRRQSMNLIGDISQ